MDVIGIANSALVTAGGLDAPASGTVETFTVTTASNFTLLTSGQVMRFIDAADEGLTKGYEVIGVTANANGTLVTWSVIRGYEGTTPKDHLPNWTMVPVLTPGGLDGRYVPESGGTLTGPLILAANPTTALGAATKQYVDASSSGGGQVIFATATVNYSDSGLATGTGPAIYTPTVNGEWVLFWWPSVGTAYNGLTPKLDLGTDFASEPLGALGQVGFNTIPLWLADAALSSNPGLLLGQPGGSWLSALITGALTGGPPAGRPEMGLTPADPLHVVVSQDGTANAAVAASLTAAAAPASFPYTVTHNSNDTFNYAAADPIEGGGAAAEEKFTFVTGGTSVAFNSLALLAAGMEAAQGTSGDTFGEYATVTASGSVLEIQAVSSTGTAVAAGFASQGNQLISGGAHDALAGLGFTGSNVLEGGLGGSPGGNQGVAVVNLIIAVP